MFCTPEINLNKCLFLKKKKYQKINAFLIFCLVSVPNIFSFSPTQIVIWLLLQLLLLQKEIIFKSFASLKMLSFFGEGIFSPHQMGGKYRQDYASWKPHMLV